MRECGFSEMGSGYFLMETRMMTGFDVDGGLPPKGKDGRCGPRLAIIGGEGGITAPISPYFHLYAGGGI